MGAHYEPRVMKLADEYVAWCRRWEDRLRRWPRWWDQIEGTASSITANLGEALDSETMPQKRTFLGYAKASCGEAVNLVVGAARNGMLPPDAGEEALRILRDIRWDLVRLIRWTRR